MSYITRRLAPGEKIVQEGEYHWFQKTWPWLALLVLGILIIGIVIWAVALFRMATTRWAVTNRRVILKRGFFVVHVDELTLGAVEGAHVDQSIFGRILGYGKLRLSGRGETELQFPTMAHPNHFRSAIERARMEAEEPHVEVVHERAVATPEEARRARRDGHESPRNRGHAPRHAN
jgi:uncharacterized membrane protein YdbT with pleckstrin-like domain